ncbi:MULTISPECIES: C39 family peptidase [Parachlamydia]|jgi:hypothetical protein|uniref:Peptidase C39-like domain-containing protein n=2 Tax=Parachlamydia acanthamoebae TaxID=83552 RepID=F8KY62_PARAV|nr:C39 family peptidase [Parachlamydia acanthamoebae]EFB40875.1 hypothetical protein pah_c180o066 [Parachlamydia acanthamoebae str. Hall's coccus]CCB85797.1 putative uncharacterized protein [Parachlamydia acanthamoebae UV-7]
MKQKLSINMLPQPNEVTCGPTCLQAVYHYYGDEVPLPKVIEEVPSLEEGGTLAVLLACHALKRGYDATIYTYNLQVFDPTWFEPKPLSNIQLAQKLKAQADAKKNKKLQIATNAYLEFLRLGGKIRFRDLSRSLIRHYLRQGVPILTGLSSTFLYHSCREIGASSQQDDILGQPEGHFVVLFGYDNQKKQILIADPFVRNPYSYDLKYSMGVDRTICSILLGVLTYDANFLLIRPSRKFKKHA